MVDQFAAELVKQIRKDLNSLADGLASGDAQSFEKYQYTCGVIRGLATAEEYIKDLAKKMEEAE
jgi:hypothetical protein